MGYHLTYYSDSEFEDDNDSRDDYIEGSDRDDYIGRYDEETHVNRARKEWDYRTDYRRGKEESEPRMPGGCRSEREDSVESEELEPECSEEGEEETEISYCSEEVRRVQVRNNQVTTGARGRGFTVPFAPSPPPAARYSTVPTVPSTVPFAPSPPPASRYSTVPFAPSPPPAVARHSARNSSKHSIRTTHRRARHVHHRRRDEGEDFYASELESESEDEDEDPTDDCIGVEEPEKDPGPLRLQENPVRLTPKREVCNCGRKATRCSAARDRAYRIEERKK